MSDVRINLIPASRLQQRELRRRRTLWGIGLTAELLLAIGSCVWVRQVWRGPNPAIAADLQEAQTHVAQLATQIAGSRASFGKLTAQRQLIQRIGDQPDWSLLLKLIDRCAEKGIALRNLKLSPEVNKDQINLSLGGVCQEPAELSQFLSRLEALKIFSSVKLVRSGREPMMNFTVTSFDATCTLDGREAQ